MLMSTLILPRYCVSDPSASSVPVKELFSVTAIIKNTRRSSMLRTDSLNYVLCMIIINVKNCGLYTS